MSSKAQMPPRKPLIMPPVSNRRRNRNNQVYMPTGFIANSNGGGAPARLGRTLNGISLVPVRTPFELKFTQIITLNTDGTTAYKTGAEAVLSLNDVSVPFPTSATHQPYGFDQLSVFYRRNKVRAVRVSFTAIVKGTEVGHSVRLYLLWQPPESTLTINAVTFAFSTLADHPQVEVLELLSGTARGIRTYSRTIDIARLAGLTRQEFDANTTTFAALLGASPTQICKLGLAVDSESTSGAQSVDILLSMVYFGEAYERIEYAGS